MLLVGVDLAPVLEVPWHPQIRRPPLTPETASTMQLSNAADGSWRCSLAETEADVQQKLGTEKRLHQLMGMVLLSRLIAELWMPTSKNTFVSGSLPGNGALRSQAGSASRLYFWCCRRKNNIKRWGNNRRIK